MYRALQYIWRTVVFFYIWVCITLTCCLNILAVMIMYTKFSHMPWSLKYRLYTDLQTNVCYFVQMLSVVIRILFSSLIFHTITAKEGLFSRLLVGIVLPKKWHQCFWRTVGQVTKTAPKSPSCLEKGSGKRWLWK